MSAARLVHVDDSLPGNLPRATRYLSRYERGFLTYLERAPAAAVLLQSA